MPSATLNRPEMLMSWDWRHRLGLTVSGAAMPSLMKPYLAGSQIGLPLAPVSTFCGSGAMKPLWAASNEVLSLNGNSCRSLALAALVASVAGLGCSWELAAGESRLTDRVSGSTDKRENVLGNLLKSTSADTNF